MRGMLVHTKALLGPALPGPPPHACTHPPAAPSRAACRPARRAPPPPAVLKLAGADKPLKPGEEPGFIREVGHAAITGFASVWNAMVRCAWLL